MGGTPSLPRNMSDASGFIRWTKWVESMISFILERLNNVLANTGLSVPSAGTTQVDGNLVVLGNFTANGKVTNDALVSPVAPGVVNQVATNFAVPLSSWTTMVSNTVTVPAGCSQLLALATGMVFVVDPNTTGGSNGTGGDIVECRIGIGGTYGMGAGMSISGSNGQTSCPAAYAALLTGLVPGNTVTLVTQATTGFQAFAANGSNQANLCATLVWLR